jgi:hypothetical protein
MKVKLILKILLPVCFVAILMLSGPGGVVAAENEKETPSTADKGIAAENETPASTDKEIAAEKEATVPADRGIAAEVVETETGIYYTIKKGDTLWDLSRKFADSPYLWPDLWSGNSKIANPHRIYPGQRIRLYRRDDAAKQTEPVEEPVVEAAAPLPEPTPPPVEEPPEEPALGTFNFAGIEQVGFIRKTPVESYGKIFRVQEPKEMIATGDIVYIAAEGDHYLIPGNRYTVYREETKVWDGKTKDYIGIQHMLLGVVEITQSESDFSIAKVTSAYINIKTGDRLMPYERRSSKIDRKKSPEGITGEIIMAEHHNKIIGDYVIAFINKGDKDGVQVGQTYNIYYQESNKLDRKRKKVTLPPVIFGEIVVLLTEENTSTVLITKASKHIAAGTKFSSPVN